MNKPGTTRTRSPGPVSIHKYEWNNASLKSKRVPRAIGDGVSTGPSITDVGELITHFDLCKQDLVAVSECLSDAVTLPPTILAKLRCVDRRHRGCAG